MKKQYVFIPIIILALIVVVMAVVMLHDNDVQSNESIAIDPERINTVNMDNITVPAESSEIVAFNYPAVHGTESAAISIVEYGAYGHPSCRSAYQQNLINDLMSEYPDRINYKFISFPMFHPNDKLATEATFCALEQGDRAFWDYHNHLLHMNVEAYNQYDRYADFIQLAGVLNLDHAAFSRCLYRGEYRIHTLALIEQGIESNLSDTVQFSVNGNMVSASQLKSEVRAIITLIDTESYVIPYEQSGPGNALYVFRLTGEINSGE